MRLTYIVLVATAAILACCDSASAMSDSKRLAVRQSHVQTELINNRFLRVPQEVADEEEDEKEEEEERTVSQLTKSLSEKYLNNAAAQVSTKLRRSKSLSELSKLDDAYYLKAIEGNNNGLFKRIEGKGYDPDGMFKRMKELDGDVISDQYTTLLQHYTTYWMAKHPSWTSKLAN